MIRGHPKAMWSLACWSLPRRRKKQNGKRHRFVKQKARRATKVKKKKKTALAALSRFLSVLAKGTAQKCPHLTEQPYSIPYVRCHNYRTGWQPVGSGQHTELNSYSIVLPTGNHGYGHRSCTTTAHSHPRTACSPLLLPVSFNMALRHGCQSAIVAEQAQRPVRSSVRRHVDWTFGSLILWFSHRFS